VLKGNIQISGRVVGDLGSLGEIVFGYVEVGKLPFIEAWLVLEGVKVLS
jgi:hypothetical protein